MVKTLFSKLMIVIYYVLGALILEALSFSVLDVGVMPEYFWFNLAIILAIAFVVYAIPNYTAQYVIYTIILLLQAVIVYVNYSLNLAFGDLFSIEQLRLLGETTQAMTSSFVHIAVIMQIIAVFMCIAIIGAIALKSCKTQKINTKEHFSLFSVIMLISVQCFSFGYVFKVRNRLSAVDNFFTRNYVTSDAFIFNTKFMKIASFKKFGTYGYLANMVVNSLSGKNQVIEQATINYFNSGNMYNGTYVGANGEIQQDGVFGSAKDQNVIVFMLESFEWYGLGNIDYNELGYNFDFGDTSNELTPNIYSLMHDKDSIVATNFFAKSKTDFSEGFGAVGNYPVGNSYNAIVGKRYDKSENTFGYSMPNVMSRKGYTTTYIHSNVLSFYNRDNTHNNLGFQTLVGKDRVITSYGEDELRYPKGHAHAGEVIYSKKDLDWNHWSAEEDFVDNTINYIIPDNFEDQPFYSFYLNVSTHGAYDEVGYNQDRIRYRDYVLYGADDCIWNDDKQKYEVDPSKRSIDLTYTNWYASLITENSLLAGNEYMLNQLVNYECGVVGLDRAIGRIREELTSRTYADGTTLAENTTILMYSDHYSYFDSMSNKVKGYALDDLTSVNLNIIPMAIYSPGISETSWYSTYNNTGNQTICDRFTSAYDIIPTLLTLLGIEYNENFYMGQNIFSPADYVYSLTGQEQDAKDMIIYYSNTGGLYCADLHSYDLKNFVFEDPTLPQEKKDELIDIFMSAVSKTLRKINYIDILNNYKLYNKILVK